MCPPPPAPVSPARTYHVDHIVQVHRIANVTSMGIFSMSGVGTRPGTVRNWVRVLVRHVLVIPRSTCLWIGCLVSHLRAPDVMAR